MKHEFPNLELIESWLDGSINKKDIEDFENRIANNSEFAYEVRILTDLINGIKFSGESETRDALGKIERQLETEEFFNHTSKIKEMNTSKKSSTGRFAAIAAAVALLLTAGYFLFQTNNEQFTDPNKAFAKHFKPESKSLGGILDNLEASGFGNPNKAKDDSLAIALNFYENHEFEKARVSLVEYVNNYPDDKIAQFYLGVTLLQQSEYAKASKHLMPLTRDDKFVNYDAAKWYLALCYSMFKTNQGASDAEKLMRSIAYDSNSGYASGAQNYMDMMGWKK